MDRLPSVIGPAPSELPFSEFLEKLSKERERVRQSLEEFRKRKTPSKKSGGRRKPRAKGITKALKEAGLSKEEFLRGIELLKEQAKEKEK